MRTDGQTDITKLIVAFRNFANAPKTNELKYNHIHIYMINKRTAEYKGNGMMLKRMEDGILPKEALNYQPRSGGNPELLTETKAGPVTCQSKRAGTLNY